MQSAMKVSAVVLLLCSINASAATAKAKAREGPSPIQQVIKMMTDMQAKITRDGEVAEKAYNEYFEWCDDAANTKGNEVKTAKSKSEKLSATIDKAKSDIEDCSTRIEELSSAIATDEEDLKAATTIRAKENKDFVAAEAELVEGIDMLERAIGVLEKELKGSSFLQAKVDTSSVRNLLSTLSTVIDAVSISSTDKQKLLALVQSNQNADDNDLEFGAPAPAAYESKSGGIVDMLNDMKEKAEEELAEARKAEKNSQHNYDMLKLSLSDSIKANTHEMKDQKADKAEAEETKAVAEGDLEVTTKELTAAEEELHTVQMDCMAEATNHEISMKGRKDELAALAKAKKIVQEAVAEIQTAAAPSLLQVAASTASKARGVRVASLVRKLAKEHHSVALAQLASRIETAMRYSSNSGEDPFAKVKNLISEMISKLMKEAQEEAEEKAYCDEEMGKTKAKKDELTDDIEGLTAKIDDAESASTTLKSEVKELQKELVDLQTLQNEMDKARQDEHAAFLESTGDLKKGLDGIRKALEVLRDYYGGEEEAALMQENAEGKFDSLIQQPAPPEQHEKSAGAGGSIISLLEVAESDFAENLTKEETEEEAAQEEYDKITQENKVTKAAKEQDVKYKTKEHKSLDKSIAEMSSDRDSLQTELDAVLEYYDKIKEKCVAKPEPYEERKKRREAEIAGLKEALSILEGESLFQRGAVRVHG